MWKWRLSVTIIEQEDSLAVLKRQEHDASIWSNLDERKRWLQWDPVNLFKTGHKNLAISICSVAVFKAFFKILRKWLIFDFKFLFFFVVKLGDLQDALQSFEKALELAKILEDDAAENAISKAINDVNNRIAQG